MAKKKKKKSQFSTSKFGQSSGSAVIKRGLPKIPTKSRTIHQIWFTAYTVRVRLGQSPDILSDAVSSKPVYRTQLYQKPYHRTPFHRSRLIEHHLVKQ